MNRQELKEFYRTHYKLNFISDGNVEINEHRKLVIKTSLDSLEEWFNKYFEIYFNKKTESANDSSTELIDSPFTANKNKLNIDETKATILVVNTYFDYLVRYQLPRFADGKARKRIRKEVYNDFIKGRYFTNEVGNRMYDLIQKLSK